MGENGDKNFCGISMSLAEYDDGRALRAFVFKYCHHLMTPLERRVTEYGVPLISNAEGKWRKLYEYLEDRDGHVDDEAVLSALQQPHETRIAAAVDRVIRECYDQINVNRCPQCSRIVRTPTAAQCLWCGNDWHGS